jgi:hypothetical protein
LVWLSFLIFTIFPGTGFLLSYFGNGRVPVAEYKGLTPAKINSAQPVSSSPVLPSPNESPTPKVAPTLAPTPSPTQAVNISSQKRQSAQKTETPSYHLKGRELYSVEVKNIILPQ